LVDVLQPWTNKFYLRRFEYFLSDINERDLKTVRAPDHFTQLGSIDIIAGTQCKVSVGKTGMRSDSIFDSVIEAQ
jgi:hypothetical protein